MLQQANILHSIGFASAYIQEISIIRSPIGRIPTVLSAKSDSEVMFCLQSYQGLKIDRSLLY